MPEPQAKGNGNGNGLLVRVSEAIADLHGRMVRIEEKADANTAAINQARGALRTVGIIGAILTLIIAAGGLIVAIINLVKG